MMTQDDIIRMAREAGFGVDIFGFWAKDGTEFERFGALVAAHEREACAQICESSIIDQYINLWNDACQHCANDIRARGEK